MRKLGFESITAPNTEETVHKYGRKCGRDRQTVRQGEGMAGSGKEGEDLSFHKET